MPAFVVFSVVLQRDEDLQYACFKRPAGVVNLGRSVKVTVGCYTLLENLLKLLQRLLGAQLKNCSD